VKVAAGSGRANDIIKLPGGDRIHVKVATQDSGGTLFMTEQPIERRGSGPPKHYHEEQDEWFYCLAGEYVVETGDQRFRLGPGDSVLGPRRVPHAFVYDGAGRDESSSDSRPPGASSSSFVTSKSGGSTLAMARRRKELVHRLYGHRECWTAAETVSDIDTSSKKMVTRLFP
jgi:mannose-6-phosphate isomerase-like protein (cupin superfamily)